MAKPILNLVDKMTTESELEKCLQKVSTEKHLCYVLIACGHPSENGEIEVEMTYEGDKTLASYLLESAQEFLDR